ncbi:hypothetical protein JOM56_015204, partial [Amanita muscaria]
LPGPAYSVPKRRLLLFFGALRIWPSRPWGDMVGFILYCMLPFEPLATGPNYMPPTPSVTSSSYHTPESRQTLKAAQRRRLRPRAIVLQCYSVQMFPGTTYTASFCWHIEHWQAFDLRMLFSGGVGGSSVPAIEGAWILDCPNCELDSWCVQNLEDEFCMATKHVKAEEGSNSSKLTYIDLA